MNDKLSRNIRAASHHLQAMNEPNLLWIRILQYPRFGGLSVKTALFGDFSRTIGGDAWARLRIG